MSFLMNKFFQH